MCGEAAALTHARRNDNLNVAIVALNHFIFRQLAARQIIFVKIDLQGSFWHVVNIIAAEY